MPYVFTTLAAAYLSLTMHLITVKKRGKGKPKRDACMKPSQDLFCHKRVLKWRLQFSFANQVSIRGSMDQLQIPELLLNSASRERRNFSNAQHSSRERHFLRNAVREESFLHLGLSQRANSVFLDSGHRYITQGSPSVCKHLPRHLPSVFIF